MSINVYITGFPTPIFSGKGGAAMDMAASVPVSAGQLVMTMEANLAYAIK
jgi:hypothetical protein